MKRPIKYLIILPVVAAILAFVVYLSIPKRSHFQAVPTPNGYDLLVRQAAQITKGSKSLKELSSNELASLVATNDAAVRNIRQALKIPSMVPVQMNEAWITSQVKDLMNLRRAAHAMDAEAWVWTQRNDYSNALAIGIDQIRFSHATMRGGLLINFLVGSACELIAVHRMTNYLSKLSADQCRQASSALKEIENHRDSFGEISARETEWQRRTYPWFVRLKEGFKKHVLQETNPFDSFVGIPEKEFAIRTLEVRRLLIQLAARAYELERGTRPSKINELVPNYLETLPRDPATGSSLDLR